MFTKPSRSERIQHFVDRVLPWKSDGVSLKILNMEIERRYRKSNIPRLEDLVGDFTTKVVNFD